MFLSSSKRRSSSTSWSEHYRTLGPPKRDTELEDGEQRPGNKHGSKVVSFAAVAPSTSAPMTATEANKENSHHHNQVAGLNATPIASLPPEKWRKPPSSSKPIKHHPAKSAPQQANLTHPSTSHLNTSVTMKEGTPIYSKCREKCHNQTPAQVSLPLATCGSVQQHRNAESSSVQPARPRSVTEQCRHHHSTKETERQQVTREVGGCKDDIVPSQVLEDTDNSSGKDGPSPKRSGDAPSQEVGGVPSQQGSGNAPSRETSGGQDGSASSREVSGGVAPSQSREHVDGAFRLASTGFETVVLKPIGCPYHLKVLKLKQLGMGGSSKVRCTAVWIASGRGCRWGSCVVFADSAVLVP